MKKIAKNHKNPKKNQKKFKNAQKKEIQESFVRAEIKRIEYLGTRAIISYYSCLHP